MTPEYVHQDLPIRSDEEWDRIMNASHILRCSVLLRQLWAIKLRDNIMKKNIGHIPVRFNVWDRDHFVSAVNLQHSNW